ncbi:Plasmodium variant antigen protein Cir/Yir/Bir, putative [Plasmodium chabaudi adami]|uniref:Plasmodium variant antigen protein Cir/Yir/Bir, putative n=1 Tax=Plasmodium chabaudi adami TaxID=5826 RepID=A0A1D3LAE6_PLACE|nr:Plasmodium variant antigen protein Cir/Yir/Bir, putative [Plasmodium chabaudi adami]
MNENMCKIFEVVWEDFPDELDSDGNYKFDAIGFCDTYCGNDCDNNCNNDIDKINAGCLFIFNSLFGDSDSYMNNAKSNMNITQYILAWLSYMLGLKNDNNINLNYFYNEYINKIKEYNIVITGAESYYNSYKDLIDQKENFMKMDKNIIFKFYDAFKSLCIMYNEINEDTTHYDKCLEKANAFAEKYTELKEDYNIDKDSSYNELLSILSNDYDSFIKKHGTLCSDLPSLSDYSRSSATKNTLIPVLSIFVAIPFFFGIAYKYSLFGFDKRHQRQYLREKIKKIKKKMASYV